MDDRLDFKMIAVSENSYRVSQSHGVIYHDLFGSRQGFFPLDKKHKSLKVNDQAG